MHDDFRVAVGLKNPATMFQLAAPFRGVGKVAVVAQRDFALVAIDHDGLRVEQSFVAGGRISSMTDRGSSWKFCQHRGLKNFFHLAHRAVKMQFLSITRNYPCRFLAAVLQSIQTEIRQVGGFRMTKDAEYSAFVVEMIVSVGELRIHCLSARSSEWAQISRSVSTDSSIMALPLSSMLKMPSAVTFPICNALIPYFCAICRMLFSEAGETEITARAPRSPNTADSAGLPFFIFMFALRVSLAFRASAEAKQDSAKVTASPPSLMS